VPINNGVILRETTDRNDNTVTLRVYYDATVPYDPATQQLIDGPRGYCLDITNVSGRNCSITIQGTTVNVGQGDPVVTGPTNGRSRTAAQMAALGFTTRQQIDAITFG
jgi:hypothetical protein